MTTCCTEPIHILFACTAYDTMPRSATLLFHVQHLRDAALPPASKQVLGREVCNLTRLCVSESVIPSTALSLLMSPPSLLLIHMTPPFPCWFLKYAGQVINDKNTNQSMLSKDKKSEEDMAKNWTQAAAFFAKLRNFPTRQTDFQLGFGQSTPALRERGRSSQPHALNSGPSRARGCNAAGPLCWARGRSRRRSSTRLATAFPTSFAPAAPRQHVVRSTEIVNFMRAPNLPQVPSHLVMHWRSVSIRSIGQM